MFSISLAFTNGLIHNITYRKRYQHVYKPLLLLLFLLLAFFSRKKWPEQPRGASAAQINIQNANSSLENLTLQIPGSMFQVPISVGRLSPVKSAEHGTEVRLVSQQVLRGKISVPGRSRRNGLTHSYGVESGCNRNTHPQCIYRFSRRRPQEIGSSHSREEGRDGTEARSRVGRTVLPRTTASGRSAPDVQPALPQPQARGQTPDLLWESPRACSREASRQKR